MHIRTRSLGRLMALALLTLCLSSGVASAQTTPPAPTVLWLYRTPGVAQPERFNLVHSRLHFEPGASTPWHTHPGQVVVTVLEGDNTFTMGDMAHVYHTGDSFIELPGTTAMEARNAGASRMSVMATYLLPWNAPLSNPVAGRPAPAVRPTTSYQYKTDIQPMTEPFDVVQQGLEFAPGAATPVHTHPGTVMVTVLAGELTFTYQGVTTVYREGESFVEAPGQVAQARNESSQPTRVMASFLLPNGAPLSQPQTASSPTLASLPNTGSTGDAWLWLLAWLGAALAGAGVWLRLRQARQ